MLKLGVVIWELAPAPFQITEIGGIMRLWLWPLLPCFHLHNKKKSIELLTILALLVACFVVCCFSFRFQFLIDDFKERLQKVVPSVGAEPLQEELVAEVGNGFFSSDHA